MGKKKIIGICRLCGTHGPLSFEHVPPRAAFNDRPAVLLTIEEGLNRVPGSRPRKMRIQQRGAGSYSLCDRCNNNTGAWYGPRFVDWCAHGMQLMIRTSGRPSLIYLNYIFPLATLKQIATMFFSVNGERFHIVNPELQAFVLDRQRKYLPPKYRFFVYFAGGGEWRHMGVTGVANVFDGTFSAFSEITFPPYGYVLTWDDPPPHPEMFEISHFARFDYNEFAVMELRLPVLPTYTQFPGDYRNLESIFKDAADAARDDA